MSGRLPAQCEGVTSPGRGRGGGVAAGRCRGGWRGVAAAGDGGYPFNGRGRPLALSRLSDWLGGASPLSRPPRRVWVRAEENGGVRGWVCPGGFGCAPLQIDRGEGRPGSPERVGGAWVSPSREVSESSCTAAFGKEQRVGRSGDMDF